MDSENEMSLSWEALEYEYKERSIDWYWAVGLLAIGGAILAIFSGDTLFGIVILIGFGMIAFLSIRKPKILPITLNRKGITIGENSIPFKKIKAFWIHESESGEYSLLFKIDRFFIPETSIPLQDVDPNMVREFFIANKIVEEEMRESQSKKILERFGL